MVKLMKKYLIVLVLLVAILTLFFDSVVFAYCTTMSVQDPTGLKSAVGTPNQCETVTLGGSQWQSLRVNDGLVISYSRPYIDGPTIERTIQEGGTKLITLLSYDAEITQNKQIRIVDTIFKNVPLTVEYVDPALLGQSGLYTAELVDVKFEKSNNVGGYTVNFRAVGNSAKLECSACQTGNNIVFSVGSWAHFVGGYNKRQIYRIETTSQNNSDLNIEGVQFDSLQGIEFAPIAPYLEVNDVKNLSVSGSEFVYYDLPAVDIKEEPAHPRSTMIRSSKYIRGLDHVPLDIDKLFLADADSNMSRLGKPNFEYVGYENGFYKIRILTNVLSTNNPEKPAEAIFNGEVCSSLQFEPYYLKYEGNDLLGAYPMTMVTSIYSEQGMNLIEIPMSQQVVVSRLDQPVQLVTLSETDSPEIFFLVHCDGKSTTFPSNNIRLITCLPKQIFDAGIEGKGTCINAPQCSAEIPCSDPEKPHCVNNECVECRDGHNEDCHYADQTCSVGTCLPVHVCEVDADCPLTDPSIPRMCYQHACVSAPGQPCVQGGEGAVCPAGQTCVNNICELTCTTATDCDQGQYCPAGICLNEPNCWLPGKPCTGGMTCVEGNCVAPPQCTEAGQCGEGMICYEGECIMQPQCLLPILPCQIGMVCINEQCVVQTQCTTAADCAEAQGCVEGKCVECISAQQLPCPGSLICINGTCSNVECSAAKPCTEVGMKCENYACVPEPECSATKSCPVGQDCVDSLCVSPPECSKDKPCSSEKVCVNGACAECYNKSDCDAGQDCVDNKCVAPSATACESDGMCGNGYYCDITDKKCKPCSEAQLVQFVCTANASLEIKNGKSICSDGKAPVCPFNSALLSTCGNACVCTQSFIAESGRDCRSIVTGLVCPPGQELDTSTQLCIKSNVVQPEAKGSGGCSLIR